jgi:glycosyltransferase involved in cell wall biosynthesis
MLEAMACRVPVIASAVGGIGDVVRSGENGLLVPEKDVDALTKAIIKLADEKNLRIRLAENGYRTAINDFSWKNIAFKYSEIYEESVKRP